MENIIDKWIQLLKKINDINRVALCEHVVKILEKYGVDKETVKKS